MTLSGDTSLWLQSKLTGLYKEDWGLIYMLYGNLASIPNQTRDRWQIGVDLIYRCLVCDLVEVNDFGATSDRESFLRAIRSLDPSTDGAGFWHATLVWGAAPLEKLVEAHFRSPNEHQETVNPPFIAALEQIFNEKGVPWSDSPLLPILPATTDASAQN